MKTPGLIAAHPCLLRECPSAPEAQQKLAGGEASRERNPRIFVKTKCAPEAAREVYERFLRSLRGAVVSSSESGGSAASPPANFRCASGATSSNTRERRKTALKK